MSNNSYIVIFPSLFAQNNIKLLMSNVKKILEIENQKFTKISRDGDLILVDANDPVFASSTINLLFGIKQILIAKQIKNDYKTIVNEITKIGSSLLLKGEKFYVSVDGKPKGYVTKDVELSATSSIIENNKKINSKPGTQERHDKLLFTYITKNNAYVNLFSDKGLGGTVNNSQNQKIICGISDEFSAITCLEAIKQGFEVKIIIFYSKYSELVDLVKILCKILPRTLQNKSHIEFYNVPIVFSGNNILYSEIISKIAIKEKISFISLPISPLNFPSSIIKKLQTKIFELGLIPFIPLSGIDEEIFQNAKEIGLEKYLPKIEKILKRKNDQASYTKSISKKIINNIHKNKKIVTVKLGPNMLHDILDSLEINH